MKFTLILLLILPLAMAASVSLGEEGEDIDKRMSFADVIALLKSLNLTGDCSKACQTHVADFAQFLCDAACKM